MIPQALIISSLTLTLSADPPKTPSWPKLYKPQTHTSPYKKIPSQNQFHQYETKNHLLSSLTPLNHSTLTDLARTIESVPHVLKRIPLPLHAPPKGGKAHILFLPDEDSFIKAGGVIGAAGYYSGRHQKIFLRQDLYFNPAQRRPTRLGPLSDQNLLVHELVHLHMHRILGRIPTWLVEGSAEYFAAAHTRHGNYQFHNIENQILTHLRNRNGAHLEKIPATPVATLIQMTYDDWRRATKLDPSSSLANYTTSLLLTHYLFHGGKERRQKTHTRLKDAHQNPHIKHPPLITIEQAAAIQKQLENYWKSNGLRLHFTSGPKP